jgi:hypothetical protein
MDCGKSSRQQRHSHPGGRSETTQGRITVVSVSISSKVRQKQINEHLGRCTNSQGHKALDVANGDGSTSKWRWRVGGAHDRTGKLPRRDSSPNRIRQREGRYCTHELRRWSRRVVVVPKTPGSMVVNRYQSYRGIDQV